MEASKKGHINIVKTLLEKGADVDASYAFKTPAHTRFPTVTTGPAAGVIISRPPAGNFISDIRAGVSPITMTPARGYQSIHFKTNKMTPLMEASQRGHLKVADILLKNGADVNAVDESGNTALILASSNGYRELIDLLLNSGAHINARTNMGLTALASAAHHDHTEIIELLLSRGTDVDITIKNSRKTPLIMSAEKGQTGIVENLLKHGADTEAKTKKDRSTALIMASVNDHFSGTFSQPPNGR